MTILDANVLLYAWDASAPQHDRVDAWLARLIEDRETIGLTWVALWAFVRVATNPKIVSSPISLERAFEKLREMLDLPRSIILEPGPRHAAILEQVASEGRAAGPRLTDAVFAALAVEYGATLASTDRDFARFPGLRWVNPLDG